MKFLISNIKVWIGQVWLALLILMLPAVSFGIERKSLKAGDIIFQDLDCGAMCAAIEAVTQGYEGLDFSHMGMVYLRNDSILIIESIGKGVILTPLDQFLKRTANRHLVGRLKPKYTGLISRALGYSLLCMGMPYDDYFLYDNGKYYCSELIYDAFKHANAGKPFFKLFPMTYKEPGTDNFYPVWETHFQQLNLQIPEGLPGCNPGGMSQSDKIRILGFLK
ncbi:MAG: hypothetical protein EOP54_11630 [Sphingobacteriales bacterium]|nr:MAG: hypothetical protein EOP54_11630 [Sphingobacteriales bacterium]